MAVGHVSRSSIVATLLVVSALAGCATMHDERRARVKDSRAEAARDVERTARTPPPEASSVYLVLKLAERRLYIVDGDDRFEKPAVLGSFPVAVGQQKYATPVGRFQVNDMVENPEWVQFDWEEPSRVIRTFPPGPDNPMGRRWIGFASAHGWQIGFHGTPHPELLGRAVSHGCVRMRNEDVVKVYDRVSLGTVVIVEP